VAALVVIKVPIRMHRTCVFEMGVRRVPEQGCRPCELSAFHLL